MTHGPYFRAALAQAALESAPPLIRTTLIEEVDFREEYGLTADAVLSFGDSGISTQRSDLLKAVRTLLSGKAETEVIDTEGRIWKLEESDGAGELPGIECSSGNERFILPPFHSLSLDRSMRLRSLDESASDVNLPSSARVRWRDILTQRPLEDEEIDEYHRDFRETPVVQARSILGDIDKGRSSVSSLVPSSRTYFERLVGSYDGSASTRDYAAGSGKAFLHGLSAWRPYDGFLSSLRLSSHSALTAEIDIEHLSSDDLVRVFEFLDEFGDRISQLGAIEVGLRALPSNPEIEPIIIRLIEQIRDDDPDGAASGFKLLSMLFILVDGELSGTRLLSEAPPFYRRLAALSQAALIQHQLVISRIKTETFCDWAYDQRSGHFYLQSLADMRTEPRWNPYYAQTSQMKADFFGRIMIAARNYEQNIKSSELSVLVLGNDPGSLGALSESFRPFLPGPLEGAEDSQEDLPSEIAETIHAELDVEEVEPSTFLVLVNSALIFRVGADQAKLATEALKLGNHRLANVEDRTQLLNVLNGLATVAAVTRSPSLADELRILVRRCGRDAEYALSIAEVINICLVASACHENLNDWRNFAGDWLTEVAFSELADEEGEALHANLRCLCHAVPELWVSCGRADAALMAFNDS